MLEDKPLDQVTEAELQALIAAGSPERRALDYKEQLPAATDGSRKEFLFDLASFANAAGGHLVYGMSETAGVPTGIHGLDLDDPEQEVLRLENMARHGLDPRILGLDWHLVPLTGGRYAIVGRIPRSWVGPHMVTFKGTNKFYSRNASGKYPLDVRELRAQFAAAEGVERQIRSFRDERLGRILARDVPVPVNGPKAVLHMVPFDAAAYGSRDRAELLFSEDWQTNNDKHLGVVTQGVGFGRFITLDGLVTYVVDEVGKAVGYTHVFLDGSVECATSGNFHPELTSFHDGYVRAFSFEEDTLIRLGHFIEAQRALGIEPPVVVTLTLLEVRRYEWIADHEPYRHTVHPLDRDTIVLPSVLLNHWPVDPASAIRPIFDSIFNAAGWPRSPYFDAEGNWGRR